MKKNMGSTDRLIRVIVAAIIVILYLTKVISGTLAMVLLFFAGAFVLISLISFCPFYVPLGIHTCSIKEKEAENKNIGG
jgi:hypothetical protein